MLKNPAKKQNTVCLVIFLSTVFFATWLFTALTPLVGDDFNYAFSWTDHMRIDNLSLVRMSMNTHRNLTHGRVFAQGWVCVFMMWPKWVFPFANAFVATAFFAALYHYFIRNQIEKPVAACGTVAALYWICMPAFGQVFLWLDGACNYFWGAALAWILLEVLCSSENCKYQWICTIVMLPIAFVTGAWSEHISFAWIVIQLLILIKCWITDGRIPAMRSLIFFAGCAGYLFLMFAPSMLPSVLKYRAINAVGDHMNTVICLVSKYWYILVALLLCGCLLRYCLKKKPDRASRWSAVLTLVFGICLLFEGYYFIEIIRVRHGFLDMLCAIVSSAQFSFLSLMSCYFFLLRRAIQKEVPSEVILETVLFGVGGFSGLALFLFAAYIPARGFCAPTIMIGIASVRLWYAVPLKKHRVRKLALIIIFGLYFITGIADIMNVHQAATERDNAINAALHSDGILTASPYPVKTKYSAQYGIMDLSKGESWPNDIIQEYYGLKKIIVIENEA